jgi:hypothetical protein
VVAATTAAPEAEKEEKKEKEKEETTQAAEQPEKEKEEKEKEKEEKEEQKPSDEDKKETTKVDFGKTPENVRSPERALSLSPPPGAKRLYVLLYTTDHGGSVQLRPASYLLPHHGRLCVWRFVEHDYRLDGTVVT